MYIQYVTAHDVTNISGTQPRKNMKTMGKVDISNHNMEQIKNANIFQMAANLKLELKTKPNHEHNIINYFFGPKYPTNQTSHGTGDQTVEHAFSMVVTTGILDLKVSNKWNHQTDLKWISRPKISCESSTRRNFQNGHPPPCCTHIFRGTLARVLI